MFSFQFMAISNLSKDKMLTVEDLTNSYMVMYKKDMILVNLLGIIFSIINNNTL